MIRGAVQAIKHEINHAKVMGGRYTIVSNELCIVIRVETLTSIYTMAVLKHPVTIKEYISVENIIGYDKKADTGKLTTSWFYNLTWS